MKNTTKKDIIQQQLLKNRKRFFQVICAGVLLPLLVIVLRLVDIQIIHNHKYLTEAKQHRTQSLTLYRRGRILDRNGVILAQDSVLYDLYAHPRYYYKARPLEIAQQLGPVMHMPVALLANKLNLPYDTIRLGKNLPKPLAKKIQKMHLPGIDAPGKMVRRYPQGTLASHILGYVNDDASISTGIEHSAEQILRKTPDIPHYESTPNGLFINVEDVAPELVVNLPQADDVQLTIDSRIQYAAETALAKGLKDSNAEKGAVLVMNPKNGEILAFAVLPDFNPEQYYKSSPEAMKNWALTDVYPPGSTFKVFTVASGLETGVIDRHSKIYDTGRLSMHGFTIQNYDYGKHGAPGNIDLVYLFQHSSNIASLLISLKMDPKDHHKLISDFGIGHKTGIDIPGESSGILLPPERWDELTHATIGYGYGLATTPVQMVAALGAIANDGVWTTPHLKMNETNIVRRRVVSQKTARTVTELLEASIDTAKTSTVKLEGIPLAGKTGTSRKPSADGRGYSTQLYTSFFGYFPAYDPKVLVMVVVDSPKTGNAWGSTVAGPIFKEIATQTAGYLGIKPVTMKLADSHSKPSM